MTEGPFVDVDMDGVCADFVGAAVRVYNRRHACEHGPIDADWREYRIERQFPKPVSDRIYGIMHEPGFFASLEPYPDAELALRGIVRLASHVEICSAPPITEINGKQTLNAYAAADKIGWLFRQFNDLALAASVTLTTKKRRIRTDVLIDDDAFGNVIPWCVDHPQGLGYLVARPWNADLGGAMVPKNMLRGSFADAPSAIGEWWAGRDRR